MLTVFLIKGKFAIHPLFNILKLLSSASDKAKFFVVIVIAMNQVSLYLNSVVKLIQNCMISFNFQIVYEVHNQLCIRL